SYAREGSIGVAADVAQCFSQQMGNVVGERVADLRLLADFDGYLDVIKLGKARGMKLQRGPQRLTRRAKLALEAFYVAPQSGNLHRRHLHQTTDVFVERMIGRDFAGQSFEPELESDIRLDRAVVDIARYFLPL